MQRFEKCDQGGRLRRTQILPIRRHVAASLDHLANELVLRQSHSNTVQSRTSLSATLTERNGSCGIASLEKRAHLAAEARLLPCRNLSGTGSPLHAFMCGLHGVNPARWVSVPSVMAISSTVKTAMGRRRQLFSPSPDKNGRRTRPAMATTGPIRSAGVSIDGGK